MSKSHHALALSPARLAANRRNARKSTGPRTRQGREVSRWNALRQCLASMSPPETIRDLGEDATQYLLVLSETFDSFPPANPFERALVEDLARLRWEGKRLQRAREAKMLKRLQAWNRDRRKRLQELDYESSNVPQEEVLQTGLRRAKDSVAKFRELLSILDDLQGIVERREFTPENLELVRGLWGEHPTMRGAAIINMFSDLIERSGNSQPGDEDSPAEDSEPAPATATAAAPEELTSEPDEEARMLLSQLKTSLAEEQRDVITEYLLYIDEYGEHWRTSLDACLAPQEDGEWRLLLRSENMNQRQIERKVRLYMELHRYNLRRREPTTQKKIV